MSQGGGLYNNVSEPAGLSGDDQRLAFIDCKTRPALCETTKFGIDPMIGGVVTGVGRAGANAVIRIIANGGAGRATSSFGGLARAAEFGIKPYGQLTRTLKGTGLQAHHLIEQRFAGVLGQKARQMASVAVTRGEHQAFTNAWRQAVPYGQGTANATRQQVLDAARQIYAKHPAILSALGL